MSSDDEGLQTPVSEEGEPGSERTLLKSDVHFAFGPQNWHWTRCGSSWRFVRSNSSDWSNLGICEPFWVAFKHDTGFIIGGEDNEGQARVVHSWNDGYMVRAGDVDAFVESRKAYIRLHDWINDRVGSNATKASEISISIGPNGSYFARAGTSNITHALPKDLLSAIEESDSPPMTIALGIRGSWIVLWSDGSRSWDLQHAYPSLASSSHLSDSSNRPVFVALNPFVEDNFFLVKQDGGCSYNVSLSDGQEVKRLHEMTDTYMRMRARRDGSSFNHSMTLNGVTKDIRITPRSGAHETRTEALMTMWRARQGSLRQRDVMFVGIVTSGAGLLARVAGLPTARAVGVAASTGVGAALSMWYRSV